METPILDFVERYAAAGAVRLHMPGHKGKPVLGCESLDITEVHGADALYEASGIIARSEALAGELFGAGRTLYSTEGSSQCIRAMLYLALVCRPANAAPVIVAARNVHKAFLTAAALLDFETVWLWPEENTSLCACPISPETLDRTLAALPALPAAVYLTSPDYLGGMADIAALAAVCHRHGTVLAVDNAHGSYLHFLKNPRHPLDLGADICCDSAHKTLSVLTGGAYLHIAKTAPAAFSDAAKAAMALFGSTSPSYLTLCSLDRCNRTLAQGYPVRLAETVARLDALRDALGREGWQVEPSDPLRLTLRGDGQALAQKLRQGGVECEYADRDFLVLMATPETTAADLAVLQRALGEAPAAISPLPQLPLPRGRQALTPREALFSPCETVAAETAVGRICGAPTVSCPPAIPIAVSGEEIGPAALALFRYYGVEQVNVVKNQQ